VNPIGEGGMVISLLSPDGRKYDKRKKQAALFLDDT
jgi:hypothetical protein